MSEVSEQIKNLVTIGSLLGTQKSTIRCPLPDHPDKNPSCQVYHDTNTWHCFGCGEGGDVFSLLMLRDRKTFPEALRELADVAGISLSNFKGSDLQTDWERKQRIQKAMEYAAEYYHQNLLQHVGGLAYLEERGISLETVKKLRLGWADGNLTKSVKRANLQGYSIDDFVAAGLIQESTKKVGSHYDYFDIRIIFPLLYRGRVLNLSGRRTELSTRTEQKYIHLAKTDIDHFYNEDAIKKKIWLFEGHPDTVIGIQCGLHAVGVIGTQGMKHPEKLKNCEKIYICGDSDHAGQKAVDKWATAILKHNPDCEILFVGLPEGIKDFNEWYLANRGQIASKYAELESSAKGLIEYKISKLESHDGLIMIWPLLHTQPEMIRDGYFKKIKEKIDCKLPDLRRAFKEWVSNRAALQTKNEITGFSFKSKSYNRLNIDFSFVGSHPTAHICLYSDVTRVNEEGKEETTYEPVLVQSGISKDGYHTEVTPLSESEGFSNSRTLPDAVIVSGRWSDDSIQKFLKGEAKENTHSLVSDLAAYFKKYIWHKDPTAYDVLALFTVGTYAARLFETFPYLALNGLAGTGKSNVIDLLNKVCFNAIKTVNISQAALFRTIEQNMPTCLRDEAEQYNTTGGNGKDPDLQDEISMLNSGYKAGNPVIRAEKDKNGNYRNAVFDVFSPKVFAGIHLLNDVLLSRAILMRTYKAPSAIIEKMPQMAQCRKKWEAEGADLRDRLYGWILTKFHILKETFEALPPVDGISNRDWELWSPLLAIAGMADSENEMLGEDWLTVRVINHATAQVKEKKAMNEDNVGERKILQTISQLLEEGEISALFEHPGWCVISSVTKAITSRLKDEGYYKDSWDMTPRNLMRVLSQTGVITDRSSQIKALWEGGKTKKCLLLTKEAVDEALSSI